MKFFKFERASLICTTVIAACALALLGDYYEILPAFPNSLDRFLAILTVIGGALLIGQALILAGYWKRFGNFLPSLIGAHLFTGGAAAYFGFLLMAGMEAGDIRQWVSFLQGPALPLLGCIISLTVMYILLERDQHTGGLKKVGDPEVPAAQ